jgi:hypothetical protein
MGNRSAERGLGHLVNRSAMPLRCAMADPKDTPEYWLKRAEEARVTAKRMIDQSGRETMEKIAELYEQLASNAAARKRPPGEG